MSKFIEQVRAKLTGQRVAVMPELSVTEMVEEVFKDTSVLQYDIGVEWKIRTHCAPQAVPHVLDNVVRQLREEIYGQFRRRAIEIQRSAYEQDYNKMHMHIRDLLREIQGHQV
jgi:hypothetical protein